MYVDYKVASKFMDRSVKDGAVFQSSKLSSQVPGSLFHPSTLNCLF